MTVTLYTKTVCPKCIFIKGELERNDVPFTMVNIDKNEEAKKFLLGQNLLTVPVLQIGESELVHEPSAMAARIEVLAEEPQQV